MEPLVLKPKQIENFSEPDVCCQRSKLIYSSSIKIYNCLHKTLKFDNNAVKILKTLYINSLHTNNLRATFMARPFLKYCVISISETWDN